MADSVNYRMRQWTPPSRPEWVRRLNEEGRCLDIQGVVPLDADSLIGQARANTGLDDFGGDDWYEPFREFLASLEAEAGLNLMGRILTRADLLVFLEARLRIEDAYKRHPEIDEQEIAPVLLVIGAGRCGTSAMQNLLALDPDNGTPRHWEAMFPCPPPEAATYRSDPRIAVADRRMTMWNRVTPEIMAMHEFAGNLPTELGQLQALSFRIIDWLLFLGYTPSFSARIAAGSNVPGLAYAKRAMKLLQWKNPRRRWLLKSPDTMRYLPEVFDVFPDTRLVWMHRDPLKTVASVVSLVGTILWIRSDKELDDQSFAHLTNPAGQAALFDTVMDQLDRGTIPAARLHNVQYTDFIADPLATIEALYREMNMELTDAARQAMAGYLHAHPRETRPRHRYATEDAGEDELFQRYRTRFQVRRESE